MWKTKTKFSTGLQLKAEIIFNNCEDFSLLCHMKWGPTYGPNRKPAMSATKNGGWGREPLALGLCIFGPSIMGD